MKTGDPYIDGKLAALHGKTYDPHKDPHFNRGYRDVMSPQRSSPSPPDAPPPPQTQAKPQGETRVSREWNTPEARAAREQFYRSQLETINTAKKKSFFSRNSKDAKAQIAHWMKRGLIAAALAFALIVAYANFGPFMSWLDDLAWQAEMSRQDAAQSQPES